MTDGLRLGMIVCSCGELCGLTFELTLTAEAGAVRPGCDDGTHWRGPALQRLPERVRVERGVRPQRD